MSISANLQFGRQVLVNGNAVSAISAPSVAVSSNGTFYTAVAGRAYQWIGRFHNTRVPISVLQIFAFSNGTWSQVSLPQIILSPNTSPSVVVRTGMWNSATADEIDVAYVDSSSALRYMTAPAGSGPTFGASTVIDTNVSSSPSLLVNVRSGESHVAASNPGGLGFYHSANGTSWSQGVVSLMSGYAAAGSPTIGGGWYLAHTDSGPSVVLNQNESEIVAVPVTWQYGFSAVGIFQVGADDSLNQVATGTPFHLDHSDVYSAIPEPATVLGVAVGGHNFVAPKVGSAYTPSSYATGAVLATDMTSAPSLTLATTGVLSASSSWVPATPGSAAPNGMSFETKYCGTPVTFTNVNGYSRSGTVAVHPLYTGTDSPADGIDWGDWLKTLANSTHYAWIKQEYGLPALSGNALSNLSLVAGSCDDSATALDMDCIVRNTLSTKAQNGTLPMSSSSTDQDEYLLIIPSSFYYSDTTTNFSHSDGYNSSFTYQDSQSKTHTIYYGVVADGAGDQTSVTASHELMENLTDPGAGGLGWWDNVSGSDCGQISDLCDGMSFPLTSPVSKTSYEYQLEWSMNLHSCRTTVNAFNSTPVFAGFLQNANPSNGGQCLDVIGAPAMSSAGVHLSSCETSLPTFGTDQVWALSAEGFLVSLVSGLCLDVDGYSYNAASGQPSDLKAGYSIHTSTCETTGKDSLGWITDQRWEFQNGFLVNSATDPASPWALPNYIASGQPILCAAPTGTLAACEFNAGAATQQKWSVIQMQ